MVGQWSYKICHQSVTCNVLRCLAIISSSFMHPILTKIFLTSSYIRYQHLQIIKPSKRTEFTVKTVRSSYLCRFSAEIRYKLFSSFDLLSFLLESLWIYLEIFLVCFGKIRMIKKWFRTFFSLFRSS